MVKNFGSGIIKIIPEHKMTVKTNPIGKWVIVNHLGQYIGVGGSFTKHISEAVRFDSDNDIPQWLIENQIVITHTAVSAPPGDWVLEANNFRGSIESWIGYPGIPSTQFILNARRFKSEDDAWEFHKEEDLITEFKPCHRPLNKPSEQIKSIVPKKNLSFNWEKKDGSLWTFKRDNVYSYIVLNDSFAFHAIVEVNQKEVFNNDGFETRSRATIEAEAFMKKIFDGEFKEEDDQREIIRKKLEAIR
jgi:hypothetical protein